jgi:hypothetical protein
MLGVEFALLADCAEVEQHNHQVGVVDPCVAVEVVVRRVLPVVHQDIEQVGIVHEIVSVHIAVEQAHLNRGGLVNFQRDARARPNSELWMRTLMSWTPTGVSCSSTVPSGLTGATISYLSSSSW